MSEVNMYIKVMYCTNMSTFSVFREKGHNDRVAWWDFPNQLFLEEGQNTQLDSSFITYVYLDCSHINASISIKYFPMGKLPYTNNMHWVIRTYISKIYHNLDVKIGLLLAHSSILSRPRKGHIEETLSTQYLTVQ